MSLKTHNRKIASHPSVRLMKNRPFRELFMWKNEIQRNWESCDYFVQRMWTVIIIWESLEWGHAEKIIFFKNECVSDLAAAQMNNRHGINPITDQRRAIPHLLLLMGCYVTKVGFQPDKIEHIGNVIMLKKLWINKFFPTKMYGLDC